MNETNNQKSKEAKLTFILLIFILGILHLSLFFIHHNPLENTSYKLILWTLIFDVASLITIVAFRNHKRLIVKAIFVIFIFNLIGLSGGPMYYKPLIGVVTSILGIVFIRTSK
jgi:RsiW-degrading membrane proteinase PrsW (M82 family)